MPPSRLATAIAMSLAFQAGAAAAKDEQAAQRGQALLAQFQCGTCHAIPGVPASRGAFAQPLGGWAHRSYIAGRLPNRPDVLARWIEAPDALVPGTTMPRMGASPQEARAMAEYLFTLE